MNQSGESDGRRARKEQERSELFLTRYAKALRDNVTRAGPIAAASYTLIGAIIVLGAIGYGLDRWRGTSPWFLLAGLLVGIIVGFVELARVVWRR